MRALFLSLILIITLLSCNNNSKIIENNVEEELEKDLVSISIKDTMDEEQEILQPEGSATEDDKRYDYLSNETTVSDCYIVSNFIDMDINYVTVDFVSYKLVEDSKNTDYEEYELINVIKTLRTFVVNDEYKTCNRSKSISFKDLIKKFEENPKTIFTIETEDGLTTELYIDDCSG